MPDPKSRLARAKDAAVQKTSQLVDVTRDKAGQAVGLVLKELDASRPLLNRLGYSVIEVILEAAMPPSVTVTLACLPEPELTLGEAADLDLPKSQKALVKSLGELQSWDSVIAEHGYAVDRVRVKLGIPPAVHAFLVPTQ